MTGKKKIIFVGGKKDFADSQEGYN